MEPCCGYPLQGYARPVLRQGHLSMAISAGARWSPGKPLSTGTAFAEKQARKPPAESASTAGSDGLSAKGVVLGRFELEPVFPEFYSYYSSFPFGTLTVKNNERSTVSDLRISHSMKQYMDMPAILIQAQTQLPGQEQLVPVQELFNDAILSITEGTLVATEFTVSYILGGKGQSKTFNVPVRILDRNSMSWFDDRCSAAYVTAKDPEILNFAKNTTGSAAGRGGNTHGPRAVRHELPGRPEVIVRRAVRHHGGHRLPAVSPADH